jgi:hypothetical protein
MARTLQADPSTWLAAAYRNEPIVTQVDDGVTAATATGQRVTRGGGDLLHEAFERARVGGQLLAQFTATGVPAVADPR